MKNEITIQFGGKSRTVTVPDSWNDLPKHQLLLFYEALFNTPGDEYTATGFTMVKLLGMLQKILQVDNDFMVEWERARITADPENGYMIFLEELRQTLRYALTGGGDEAAPGGGLFRIEENEDGETMYSANLNLTCNPWPEINGLKFGQEKMPRIFYAPSDGLGNLTIYEMGMTFSLFEAYLSTGDIAHAHQLIATIYRPSRVQTKKELESNWAGDRRQPIRHFETVVDNRIKWAEGLPMLVKRVILFWFAGCRQQIVNQFPKVFKSGGKGEPNEYGWGGVLLSVAEAGPMGALGEVADQHYSNVLTYLSIKADEAKERENAMKKKG